MNSDLPSSNNHPSPDEIVSSADELCLHIEAMMLYVTRRMRMVLLGNVKVELEEYDFERMAALFNDPSASVNIHDIELQGVCARQRTSAGSSGAEEELIEVGYHTAQNELQNWKPGM